MKNSRISFSHGSGGRAMHELIESVFLSRFGGEALAELDDSAFLEIRDAGRGIAFTTDSFVVSPAFFPGGDIGKLAVCGSINDLAVSGARPRYLSAGFIVEEGFELRLLETIAESMACACRADGVEIAAGDFKVVEKGSADGVFINTAGIGILPPGPVLSMGSILPSDKILVNGSIGDHEAAVLAARGGFKFRSSVKSDCCSLYPLISRMCELHNRVLAESGRLPLRFMRDPTRGGVATVLNEIARGAAAGMEIFEAELPVKSDVLSVCEMLGLDPLYMANEGKVLAVVGREDADDFLELMKSHPLGTESRIIGQVAAKPAGRVLLETCIGGKRIVGMLEGAQLPRIC